MADALPVRFNDLAAPYIADTTLLIQAASNKAQHVMLYRSGDISNNKPRDLFAAGQFKVHKYPWPETGCRSDGQGSAGALALLSESTAMLAGYISYEAGFAFEPAKWAELPLGDRGFVWRFVEIPCWYEADHSARTGKICATPLATSRDIGKLRNLVDAAGQLKPDNFSQVSSLSQADIADAGEFTQAEYESVIREILDDITAGRFYELNFTQRFRVIAAASPANVFARLFKMLLPRRGFFADFGDEAIISVSPELFLHKAGERIITQPIKGSMGGVASEDELEKLHAEHLMVVDLARNDMGRISDCGWVTTGDLAKIGKFGQLQHLETAVYGYTLLKWPDILSGTFPAASITGTPKVMVVQAIAEYEKSPRNLYTGSCGCIWPGGDFDLNVAIRTMSATPIGDKWHYELGAGGAITSDSDPAAEYAECLAKANPLVQALLCE